MSAKKIHYGVRLRIDQMLYLQENATNISEWIRDAIDEKISLTKQRRIEKTVNIILLVPKIILDSKKLKIIEALQSGPKTVEEINGDTGIHINTLRYQLPRLIGAGLVSETKKKPKRYRLTVETLKCVV